MMRVMGLLLASTLVPLSALAQTAPAPTEQEFVGPFASWADAQRDYVQPGIARGLCSKADVAPCLQAALNDIGTPGHSSTLYLPAGDYPIGRTLKLRKRSAVTIVGEDPVKTRVLYNGSKGNGTAANSGAMILFSGVPYSRMGRITWDGQGKATFGAAHRWESYDSDEPFPTHFVHFDEVFQNMGTGIQGGGLNRTAKNPDGSVYVYQSSQSEVLVERTTFRNIAFSGIYLADFNSLQWWVRDSRFQTSGNGVNVGAGQVFVYGSQFTRNGVDVQLGNIGPSSVRDSFSSGSGVFVQTGGPTGAQPIITLQRNVVVNPTDVAVRDLTLGTLTLLDNRFAGDHSVVARFSYALPASTLAVANAFSATSGFQFDPKKFRLRSVGDTMGVTRIDTTPPVLPATPVHIVPGVNRPLFDVTGSTPTGDAIQAAIKKAAAVAGRHPIVHIAEQPATATSQPAYVLNAPLDIPASTDMTIVGDSPYFASRTLLQGADSGVTALMRVHGPTHVTLKDFTLNAARDGSNLPVGSGLVVTNADQRGGRAFLQWPSGQGNPNTGGMVIAGLDQTIVEAQDALFGADFFGVRVTGGPLAASGQPVPARVRFLGGGPGTPLKPVYFVRDGGNVTVQDVWYESRSNPVQLVNVAGPSSLAISTSSSGQSVVSSAFFQQRDQTSKLSVLDFGLANVGINAAGGGALFVAQSFTSGRASIPAAALRLGNQADNNRQLSDTVGLTDAQIIAALRPLREAKASSTLPPIADPNITDFRLYRVGFNGAATQFVIQAGP